MSIFIDESGDPTVPIRDEGNYLFSAAAVIVESDKLNEVRDQAGAICRSHFDKGEMKSSGIKKRSFARRLRVLNDIKTLDFQYRALVVDKREIDTESGLKYRGSFIKYTLGILYEDLFRLYHKARVYADQYGTPQFELSNRKYIERKGQISLLDPDVEFMSSTKEPLLQVADMIAGSIRIAHLDELSNDESKAILERLEGKCIDIRSWPARGRTGAALPTLPPNSSDDSAILSASRESAHVYLKQNEESQDSDNKARISLLQDLMEAVDFGSTNTWKTQDELAENLKRRGFQDFSKDRVRCVLIAGLRDSGVLVVSSAKGYRLASAVSDLSTYFSRQQSEIGPILNRVRRMNSHIKAKTHGRIHPLKDPMLEELYKLVRFHNSGIKSLKKESGFSGSDDDKPQKNGDP